MRGLIGALVAGGWPAVRDGLALGAFLAGCWGLLLIGWAAS